MLFRIAIVGLACMLLPASALAMPPVVVIAEDLRSGAEDCGVDKESLIAAAEAALRYNQVQIAKPTSFDRGEAVAGYISNAAVFGTTCSFYLDFSFRIFETVVPKIEKKPMRLTVVFCEEGSIFTGNRSDMQSRLNDFLRDTVDKCVSEYEKRTGG